MAAEIIMPSLGESVFEGTIAKWLKQEGDEVKQYEPILEIETDKVTTEATAEISGTLLKIMVSEGETVEVGTVLAYVGNPEEEIPESDEPSTAESVIERKQQTSEKSPTIVRTPTQSKRPKPASNGPGQATRRYTGRISPVVGRIAEEHQVDLNLVTGTGRDGRITKKDILAYIEEGDQRSYQPSKTQVATTAPPSPSKLAQEAIPGEILALNSMRQAIAEHMVRSKRTSPHVTTVFDIDFTAVDSHRNAHKQEFKRDGVNLTFTAYVVYTIVQALKAYPIVNSAWTEEGILLKREINVGMATAIADGLIVPVIKDADDLSLLGIARTINDLSTRARNNQLLPDEVQGGTLTLTNHGVSGSLFATPIINQPQCGILGLGKIEKRVKVIDDAIAIRLMAYASLTFDHRILDGASADAFMSTFKEVLENWS